MPVPTDRFSRAWLPPDPPGPAPALPENLLAALRRSGLGLPAYLFLELQRPLLFVYGQYLRLGASAFPGAERLAGWLEGLDPETLLGEDPCDPT